MASKAGSKEIWFVGGGTGGHIMPLIAVAHALKRRKGVRITFLGDPKGKELQLIKQLGLPFLKLPYGKIRRYLTLGSFVANMRDIIYVFWGIITAYFLIRRRRPTLVFSKGGPVALPLAIAAFLTKTPLITHESDAVIGVTNRIIARFAQMVLTGFPASVYPSGLASKIRWVGVPIRPEFCQRRQPHRSRRPMVLVTGGSQGAAPINDLIGDILPELLKEVDVMHLTGAKSFSTFQAVKDALPAHLADHYGVIDYTPDIASYMHEAEVVVMRAGSQIFEMASMGKPMILIPLPSAANNHQLKNAEIFAQQSAALMLRQDNLTPNRLYETIRSLLNDRALQKELRQGMRQFDCCRAAERVADILTEQLSITHNE